MAIYNPQPLSWGERLEKAQYLRAEAEKNIKEAERLENGVKEDQKAIAEAITKARQDKEQP